MKRHLILVAVLALIAAACTTGAGDATQPPTDTPDVAGLCPQDNPDCGVDDIVADPGPAAGTCLEGTDCDDIMEEPVGPGLLVDDDETTTGGMLAGGGLTVSEALVTDATGVLAVQGFLVSDAQGLRLCEALAESFPPQCGGASIEVGELADLEELTTEAEGVRWSDSHVVIYGEIVDGVLVPSDNVTG